MSTEKIIAERYALSSIIGQGGMGTVYRGVDTRTGDTVAIKALKPEIILRDPDILTRFEREADALRRLNHPNIVKVLATVEEDELHYMVMEFVGGGSLRDLLDQEEKLSVERTLNIALDLADALARAHRLRIIHRDIKPANVLLAEDGTPRLTDFGVAFVGDSTQLTATGSVVGTLAYLSPEAISGERLDERADIWAFGVMLYEMVAGQRPFTGENTAALLHAILSKSPPDLAKLRPGLDWSVGGLIYWMLEKERDQRIGSVRMVGALVEKMLAGEPLGLPDQTDLPYDPNQSQLPLRDIIERRFSTDDFDFTPKPLLGQEGAFEAEDFEIRETTIDQNKTSVISSGTNIGADVPISRSDWSLQVKRKLDHPPRIFLSYRRADSIAVTGRIYDRLVTAFGAENVFKDEDNIPPGANFESVLENQLSMCDVMLIIIGQTWASVKDEAGNPRLHQESDTVRMEVQTALGRTDRLMVIPILVNNATIPTIQELPESLHRLTYHNAAVIRNDPDFNRDVQWLIQQINNSFDVAQKAKLSWWIIGTVVVIAAIVLLGFGLFAMNGGTPTESTGDNGSAAITDFQVNPPIEAGQVLALIAEMEQIGGETRDVQRFILDDLQQVYEAEIPFSNVAVRAYPGIITSDAEAITIAQSVGATVIAWGNYNDERVQVELQIGDISDYPDIPFARDLLEDHMNVRLQLSDEFNQSIAPFVINIIGSLNYSEGDNYENARALAILAEIGELRQAAEVVGTDTAAHIHRALMVYQTDSETALESINLAQERSPDNPLIYPMRSVLHLRLENFAQAYQDIDTTERFAEDWLFVPLMRAFIAMVENDIENAVLFQQQVIQLQPDDWWQQYILGLYHYVNGDIREAKAQIDIAIGLEPTANFPYAFASMIALREGRFLDAQQLFNTAFERFPDPTWGNRIAQALIGGSETVTYPFDVGNVVAAFSNITLGQYEQVVQNIEAALAVNDTLADQYFVLGLAQCNLGDYAAAEAAYSRGIELEPDYTLLYAMRTEVRGYQGNLMGAAADLQQVNQSDLAEMFTPFVGAFASGDVSCENLLDANLEAILAGGE